MAQKLWPAHVLRAENAETLAGIHDSAITMAVWERSLPVDLEAEIRALPINAYPNVRLITDEPAKDIRSAFEDAAREAGVPVPELLCADVIAKAELYRTVTGIKRILVRIERITERRRRFLHVDGVAVRLLTTYCGLATLWLANADVKREGLGKCNNAGVYRTPSDVRRLLPGHVSFMKGEKWPGNEGAGLVHGEPCVQRPSHQRMSLVIDDARNAPDDLERLARFLLNTP